MLKKIVLWTLYAAFVGVLIIGGINRTMAKNGDADSVLNGVVDRQFDSFAQRSSETVVGNNVENTAHDETQHDWVTMTGTVSSILPRGMVVADAAGQLIEIARRPWRFAQEQGFLSQVGDQVVMHGFYEGTEFELGQLTNLTTGQTVFLRDELGHPLWEGGGNE